MPKPSTIRGNKQTVRTAVTPAKPSDKDQLLNDAAELIRSLRRIAQDSTDAATSTWLNRYHESRKGA